MKIDRYRRRITVMAIAFLAAQTLRSFAAIHYVSQTSASPTPPYSTPDTAARDIQSAVDVSIDGDTVLVEPGDYGVTNQINVINAVRLQSTGGANQTFLTAYGSWCLAISNALAAADGFSLRPGTGDPGGAILVGGTIQSCNFTNFDGYHGSILMSGGTVSNVVVDYLRVLEGVAVYSSDAGLITDCLILADTGYTYSANGGAVALVNSRLQNSVISGLPNGPGKGVAVSAVSSTIVGCTVSNNYNFGKGGGAYLQDSLMDRCIVTGNTNSYGDLGYGGGGIFETNSVIRNSLIARNYSTLGEGGPPGDGGFGGGVYMQGGAIINCTVSENLAYNADDAPGAGGGVYVEGNGTVTNSIIYFNSVSGASGSSSNWFNAVSGIFDHCCTTPDPGGAGNVIADPQFVNTAGGNFHLSPSSPCIGAGVVQPWMAGAQDLDGNSRTTGDSVDLGAYEYRPFLTMRRASPNVVVSWPSGGSAGFILEQSSNLGTPQVWTSNSANVNDDGTNKSVTIAPTNNLQVFRLYLP